MKFRPVPIDEAKGKILGHNIAQPDGRRALRKGSLISDEDVSTLRNLDHSVVYVADLDEDDIDEDTAARRLAEVVTGKGLRLSGTAAGRVNLLASAPGVLRVDAERLERINENEGITLSTLHTNIAIPSRRIVATVKVIPFAVPEAHVRAAEQTADNGGPIVYVDELLPCNVGLILAGSSSIKEKLTEDFAPLRQRVETLGSQLTFIDYVALDGDQGKGPLSEALKRQQSAGADLIILAGETAIMDRNDLQPRAVEGIGGHVECVGAPVDPGNLLMLAYLEDVPIVGAPGCARSQKPNVIDQVLPRLLAGEQLQRGDIIKMGHGGMLIGAPESSMLSAGIGNTDQ